MKFPRRLDGRGLPPGSSAETPKVRKPAYKAAELARILDAWTPAALLRLLRKGKVDLFRGRVWISHIRREMPELYEYLERKIEQLEAGNDGPLEREPEEDEDGLKWG